MPPGIAALSARLSQIGFERTRRALAALSLSVFISIYLLVSLNAPEGFARVFVALALCYGVAFFAVVAEWFWGRWFATGLAWSGVMIAVAGLVAVGWMPQLVIFGVLHLFVIVAADGREDGGPLRPAGGAGASATRWTTSASRGCRRRSPGRRRRCPA